EPPASRGAESSAAGPGIQRQEGSEAQVKSAEGSGRTVEEAIREALKILGARREDVDLMVLDEGSRGVLGLGSRVARVRLSLLSEMEDEEAPSQESVAPSALAGVDAGEAVGLAQGVTSSLVEGMGFQAT